MKNLWANEFGPYEWSQYLLHLIPAFTTGMHVLSLVETGATPKHRCLEVNDTIMEYQGSCHYISEKNETTPCEAWEYDRTYYHSTTVTEWNLVCDKRWMAAVTQSIYMLGSLVANLTLSQFSDRYGRWKVLVPTGALQMVFAISCGFVRNYYVYNILRFLVAYNATGSYTSSFVLALEMAPDRLRTVIGFSFQLSFAVGIMAVAGWAYLVPEWAILQIIFGLHSSVILLHYWLVDESPRWLFFQGRYAEAEAIVYKMLRRNRKSHAIPDQAFTTHELGQVLGLPSTKILSGSVIENRKYGMVDLFKTPRLRCRTLNVSLNWFANSLVYYGLSLNTGALVGDPHLMLFISGLVEVPASLISIKSINVLGRRSVISFCLTVGGIACIFTTYFPQTSFTWTTVTVCLVMSAKALISISFSTAYNYTAELFPTVVRGSAIGTASLFSVTSSILTPLIFLMDSVNPKLPSVLFGVTALIAGFFSLYLPETRDCPLLHTLMEGEEFGRGDTFFSGLCVDKSTKHALHASSSDVQLNKLELGKKIKSKPVATRSDMYKPVSIVEK